jgi:hypothetical protein
MEHSILSFMVDWQWYARRHGLEMQQAAAQTHFCEIGLERNLDPNPLFNSQWYREQYPESRQTTTFQHFISSPVSQRLNPSPLFDSDWYLANNADVRDAGLNPFMHFMQWGRWEGRFPNPWCDPNFKGASSFSPALYPNFSAEDLIGYIPHYTTMDRLVTGAEASAIFSPGTPFWLFSRVKSLQLENLAGRQVSVVGGRCEVFCGNIAYMPHRKLEIDDDIFAIQVRYAVSPAIKNAISALGQPFHSLEDFDRLEQQIAARLQEKDIAPAIIDILIDAEAHSRVKDYLRNSTLAEYRLIGLGSGYICRVENLLYVALGKKNATRSDSAIVPNKSGLLGRWKRRLSRSDNRRLP